MYSATNRSIWSGRMDSETDETMFRLHQVIQAENLSSFTDKQTDLSIGLIGFKSDEGVRRNQGRIGARHAPDEIRKSLASLPYSFPKQMKIFDFGNISCGDRQLEKAQAELGEAVSKLLSLNIFPIILGGGHEVAYGHFLGAQGYISNKENIGIINIDAHFDMRPYDDMISSGTMFRQILDQYHNAQYFCIGIQKSGNTQYLFDVAKSYGCGYISEEALTEGDINASIQKIQHFINANDHIILTLCSDVFGYSYAPGVSAPSPFGLSPKIVRRLIKEVLSSKKVLSFDIAEINPSLDHTGETVKLAAYMIYEVMDNLSN
ncbi:formiminoglutamase [Scopulibacillus daqui]|uniref:Formimidoylglutamase n=1 Tax=Scopulibacillus daqui TaxID=1469162 RepID=A0ABS2PW92_9BACL|nr:formimidoylglutamase [Scopulibacillus daqui]MBM7644201.1 formiminoglutamase [Scopulibacillus daqui]